MVIYKTTNLINNKIYIGQDSKNNPNYLGSGIYLNNAIKKYGKENFKKEIICECKSKIELNRMEIEMIKNNHSHISEGGYNITWGGDGGDTFTYSLNKEKTRRKISEKSKGRIITNETKEKIREKQVGVPRYYMRGELNPSKRPEVREKARLNNLGEKNPMFCHIYTLEEKEKLSISHLGHDVTQETKNKISQSLRGRKLSEEICLKISKTLTGKKQSDYTKRKRLETRNKSKILRGKW